MVERTINNRIIRKLEERNVTPQHQFGFRRQHATTHQPFRITEDIMEGFNTPKQTAAIFLDVEKKSVWHKGMLHKMRKINPPTWITKLTASYLQNRRYTVKVNDAVSSQKQANAGVPQGSILGLTIFNLYIANMPKTEKCKVAQYADDTMIYKQGRRTTTLTKKLQTDLYTIIKWFIKWKM